MADQNHLSGIAALSIIEALMLAMNDHEVLPEREIVGVLRDAAAAHENVEGSNDEMQTNKDVAALINKIIAGGNSVRR